ncbi:MAG TPA: helicase-associated domain-containing protein [Ktedonobacteraceae bacterium]|nr:helicase-associated domain-containing protein [Ktedonobacteraceae bacterium]
MEQGDLYLLQTVPPYHLQAIVKARSSLQNVIRKSDGLTDAALTKLPEMADLLFDRSTCRELLRTLNNPETSVLRELVACGGRANSRDLALYFSLTDAQFAPTSSQTQGRGENSTGHAVPAGRLSGNPGTPSLYPNPHPHGAFEQVLHRLLILGLLFWGKQTNFVGRDYANGVYDGVLIVPPTVLEIAEQEWKHQIETPVLSSNEITGEGIAAFQRVLYLYWSLVANARDGLPLVSSRLLSRAALRQVIEHLASSSKFLQGLSSDLIHTENDAPPLLFLRLLLMKLGLLTEKQGALHALPAQDFFSLPLSERAWRCFRLWLETPFWNELVLIPDVVVRPGPSPLEPAHEEVVYSRQLVVEHVLHCTPETWYSLAGFVARLKLHAPYLLFPRQYGARAERYSVGSNPYGWDFRLRRGWLTHREGWHMVEGGFVRALLNGPLTWLGVVDQDEHEHAGAFCLSQGSTLFANEKVPDIPDPAWGRLVVQPNFDLVALAPVSESLLIELDRFAERVRLEHIAQYRLSKASVTRAVQLGLTADDIIQLLEHAAASVLPQNVQYSLHEWERQARRIELWRAATLMEVEDPALLDELFAEPGTRAWLGRRLAPTLAEVATQHLAQLQELLWRRDYLPALASASRYTNLLNGASLPTREAQWTLLPDGLFQPRYALSNLYLATELDRVTELDETTGWRKITPASLQKALAAGLQLSQILQFLENYCVGGVPGSFLIRLKLWGEGYSEPPALQIEQAPLLSLSASVLQDILSDEELGPLLDTPVSAEKRLVHVAPQNLERVVQLLRERGFEIF